MLKLPRIPYSMEKNKRQVVSMGSINYSKMTNDGDIADSGGVSGRHFPLITTARGNRVQINSYDSDAELKAITFFRGELVEIYNNGQVWYGGSCVGVLPVNDTDYSDIQFAAINTKLVIMPFKKYLDVGGEEARIKSLGAKITTTASITFKANSVQLDGEKEQSYEMLGGKITEGVYFSTRIRETGFDFNKDVNLVYDNSTKSLTAIKLMNSATMSDVSTLKTYATGSQIYSMSTYGVYIVNNSSGYCEWRIVERVDKMATYQDDWYSVTIYLSDSLPNISSSISIYTRGIFPEWFSEEKSARFRLKAPYSYSKYEYDFFARFNPDEGHRRITLEGIGSSDIPYIGKYLLKGNIDDGLWSGDFRDFLSAGREVTLTYINSTSNASVEVLGTVSEVGVNNFKVDYFSLGGALFAEDEITTVITITAKENKSADLSKLFVAGDVVSIRGCSIAKNNIDFKIDSIDGKTLYAASDVFEPSPSTAATVDETGEETGEVDTVGEGLTIERRIPTLDYICESDNRLYGCSNEDNTIYVSALGDPTNIYAYQGISTDSYAVAVASEEPFTGCCPYDGGVLFWKENKLHKLLGSYPAEYALYTYNIDGVQEGSHKSLQNIGEVLYYKGVRGVFAFNGSPQLISSNFGDKYFKDAVAGSDGDHYLISMKSEEGGQHFFSYDTRSGLWVREGSGKIEAFARKGKDVYLLEDGKVCVYGAEETPADAEWFIQFAPIYETIEGQKSYSRIKLRIELPRESYIVISVRCDGGRWAECGKIVGRVEGVIPVMVPINRCDKFELKIEGKGPCTIHSILREYFVGAYG